MMDPRKLLHLAAVIEYGSFKKASRQLDISQPALWSSIERLERSIGERLLERSPYGVSPTPMGEMLYSHARLIRGELDLAERCLTGHEARRDDVVVIGVLPSLTVNLVPKAVSRWRREYPDTMLRIVEKFHLELLLSMVRGQLDLIITQKDDFGLVNSAKERVLFSERFYIVGRPEHPAFGSHNVALSELVCYPWVIQSTGPPQTFLQKLLASEGLDIPRRLTECGSVAFIKCIVMESDCLAILPASAADIEIRQERLRVFEIGGPLLSRDIAVISRERTPWNPAARDLVHAIESIGQALG